MKKDDFFQTKKDRRRSVLRWCVIGVLLGLAGLLLVWNPPGEEEAVPGPSPTASVAPAQNDRRSARESAYDKERLPPWPISRCVWDLWSDTLW